MEIFPLFIIPIVLGIVTQGIKVIIQFARGNRNIRTFLMNGGFPSAHSGFVASLVTIVFLAEGWQSTSFTVALVLATIIIHDAVRVRIHIGKNGKAINTILRTLKKSEEGKKYKNIEECIEITGHNPEEVAAGALIGVLGSLLLYYLFF